MISCPSFVGGKVMLSSETCTPWPIPLWDISSPFFLRDLRAMFETSMVETHAFESVASFWEQNLHLTLCLPIPSSYFHFDSLTISVRQLLQRFPLLLHMLHSLHELLKDLDCIHNQSKRIYWHDPRFHHILLSISMGPHLKTALLFHQILQSTLNNDHAM